MEKVPQYNEREPSAQAMTDQEMTPDKETSATQKLRPCFHEGEDKEYIVCDRCISQWNSDFDSLRAENEKLKEAYHRARLLWCDSKRDKETGFVDIKYLDQFDNYTVHTKVEESSR